MSTLDTGSARSRLNIYGQRIIWVVYIMKHYNELVTSYYRLYPQRYGRLLLIEAIYYQWMMSLDVVITMSIYGTLILNLLPTSYVTRTHSSSDVAIASVCKYSGIRLLQSTYLIMQVQLV